MLLVALIAALPGGVSILVLLLLPMVSEPGSIGAGSARHRSRQEWDIRGTVKINIEQQSGTHVILSILGPREAIGR